MSELNAEQVKKALECCAYGLCRDCALYSDDGCGNKVTIGAIELINSQEQRIKELTEEVESLTETVRVRGETIEKLQFSVTDISEDNRKLTEENEAWQNRLINTKQQADKSYYELACEVENLRAENESLREDNKIKSQKRANIFEIANAYERGKADTVRKMQELITERASNGYPRKVRLDVIEKIAKEMLEEG